MRLISFLVVPAAVGYGLFGPTLVRVALNHGAFSAASAERTGTVLALMALGLPAFAAYLFLMAAYQAMQNTRTMFVVYCVENAANVVFAVALYPLMGLRGLAVAFAAAYGVGCLAAMWDLRRRVGSLGVASALTRIAVAGAAAAIAAVLTRNALGGRAALPSAAAGLAGTGAYLLAARRLALPELSAALTLTTRTRPP